MLLGEQALVTAIGLPLGTLIGVGLTVLIIQTYDTDLYRIPLALEAKPFLWAAAMIVFVAAAAGLLVRRQLDRADLIAVLKTRE
jgi:putative ABC transport system permease protein